MQVEDLIYYIAAEEIQEGSELRVWYAPFYQQKIKEELKALGYSQTLVSTAVVTRRVPVKQSLPTFSTGAPLHISHTLSRIVVGRGQVTFTHNAREGERDSQFLEQLTVTGGNFRVDKYKSSEIVKGRQNHSTNACGYSHENYIQRKKKDLNSSHDIGYVSQTEETNTTASIQLVNNRDNERELECIVTFTITAASENHDLGSYHSEHYGSNNFQSENCPNGDDTHEESLEGRDRKQSSFPSTTLKRKYYKLREPKSGIVAKVIAFFFLHQVCVLYLFRRR